MKRGLLVLLLLLAIPCRADMLLKDFRVLAAADAHSADKYLEGVSSAYAWANAILDLEKQSPMFCVPSGRLLTLENYRRALDDATREISEDEAGAIDVPILMLKGLRQAYPCETNDRRQAHWVPLKGVQ